MKQIFPKASDDRIIVGPIFLTLLLSFYKSHHLLSEIVGGQRFSYFFYLVFIDFVTVGILLFVCCGIKYASWVITRWVWILLFIVISAAYLLDCFLLLIFDTRFDLFDLLKFHGSWKNVSDFIGLKEGSVLLLFFGSFLISVRGSQLPGRVSFMLGLFFVGMGVLAAYRAPVVLARYSEPVVSQLFLLPRKNQIESDFRYTKEQRCRYARQFADAYTMKFLNDDPNIIVLIVESLSAADSKNISGIHDRLTEFDQLSTEGLLFNNFFANYRASDGGIAALLSGVPPLYYPSASTDISRDFGGQPSTVGSFNKRGYHTEYLSTYPLGFLDMGYYLRELGFARFRGKEEVELFRNTEGRVFSSPSDVYLYREGLERVASLSKNEEPFFLVLATSSSHPPYSHPITNSKDPKDLWRWVGSNIKSFYEDLRQQQFFENGILIITADHRAMRPVAEKEFRRYGMSAKARIPLLIIGSGVPAGKHDNRFLQQSDLLRLLPDVLNPGSPLSPNPIWIDRYNSGWGRLHNAGYLTVFSELDKGAKGYEAYFRNDKVLWLKGRPIESRALEKNLNSQRAIHQFIKEGTLRANPQLYFEARAEPISTWCR